MAMRVLSLCVLIACAGPRAPQISPPPVIATDRGAVSGHDHDGVRAFLGIPYATAPRWQPPGPVAPWPTPRDATQPGPACPQPKRTGTSEDCLTLNVWAPGGAHLPVL